MHIQIERRKDNGEWAESPLSCFIWQDSQAPQAPHAPILTGDPSECYIENGFLFVAGAGAGAYVCDRHAPDLVAHIYERGMYYGFNKYP